ncbi:MAG: YncE family protein, partial [Gemmatimonadetes bacterium]|nr:YncE family protein [Gemmatimonadota bacterium]
MTQLAVSSRSGRAAALALLLAGCAPAAAPVATSAPPPATSAPAAAPVATSAPPPATSAPAAAPAPVGAPAPVAAPAPPRDTLRPRLPTGVYLDPAGPTHDVGPLPLSMLPAPEGDRVVLLLSGWRQQGVQVVERASGRVLQTLAQPAAFVGAAFAPDGRTLYASGGNQDVVYRYAWANGAATLRDSLVLAVKDPKKAGTRYPAGIGVSPDGRWLYAAENMADSLAVVDLATGRVARRLPTGRYPYGVAVARDGTVYVSAWGGETVSVFAPRAGRLASVGRIEVGRHPSALLLNRDGSRLFVASGSTDRVAVVDTRARRVLRALLDPPPAGPNEGSTPNALALSDDGTRLFVAEGDANAVAVFDLSRSSAGIAAATGDDRLAGRIPAGWYPSAVLAMGDTLLVASGKGRGTLPNPDGPQPIQSREHQGSGGNTTLRQISGTLMVAPLVRVAGAELDGLTARVVSANGWNRPRGAARGYPPFTHVVYVIKENRTYDQVLGDLPQADGDSTLLFFGRESSPNHHALAERFGIFDRFFTNAEVSPDGHNWSTAAYTTDYLQKTVPSNYSGRGRSYDYEGTNRGSFEHPIIPDDDVAEPAHGYLWDLAARKGITFRNYGEFVIPEGRDKDDAMPRGYRGTKPFLARNTHPTFPGFGQDIPDQHRADL